jgi:hypothetical protein
MDCECRRRHCFHFCGGSLAAGPGAPNLPLWALGRYVRLEASGHVIAVVDLRLQHKKDVESVVVVVDHTARTNLPTSSLIAALHHHIHTVECTW